MSTPAWFPTMNGGSHVGWERSSNSGGSWTAGFSLPTAQQVGPHGLERFRLIHNVPPGLPAGTTLCITVSGDIYANEAADAADVFYDGVSLGDVRNPATSSRNGPETFCVPAIAGAHTFELRIGSAPLAGVTNPLITATIQVPIPCQVCDVLDGCQIGTGLPVFGERDTATGVVTWYNLNGDVVPASQVSTCCECFAPAASVDVEAAPITIPTKDGQNHPFVGTDIVNLQVPDSTPSSITCAPRFATIRRLAGVLGASAYSGAGLLTTTNPSGTTQYEMTFAQPVDLRLDASSFNQGTGEVFTVVTPVSEFVAGPGSTQPTNPLGMPTGTNWGNGNNLSPSFFIYRNVTVVRFNVSGPNNLTSTITPRLLEYIPGWVAVPCGGP